MPSMNFLLTGRDQLSRVLDRAGDSSDRLGRRLVAMSINGDAAVRRFTNNSTRYLNGLQRDTEAGGKALDELKKVTMLLAPAAIPAAASLAPIAAGAGTVAVAVAAMGAAIAPQIAQLGEASQAQKKYEDAVGKSGRTSQEAVQAQVEYARIMAELPPETREAAAAVGVLKDEYKGWSDSLAGDTMAPFTKGVQLTNALLPKTTGLVKATSAETDRFLTLIGGEMASPGLDRLDQQFTSFTQRTLRSLNNELVHLLRTSRSGEVGGDAREFMEWARAQGPTVASVLQNVATTLFNVLEAGSDVGVGLLDAVEVITDLVSAVPPEAIAIFLQLALAMKLTKMAALGLVAGRTAVAAFGAQLLAMQAAATAAPGRLGAVTAAMGAMSRGAKLALVGSGIGLLVILLTQLAGVGKQAPPDVDRLTTSLGNLGRTGKVSGEAAKAFGADLGGLADSLRVLSRPSNLDATQQFLTSLIGMDSTPVAQAKENLDAVDKALAGLVQGGKADLAAAAYDRVAASMRKQGMTSSELKAELGDYESALADAKFEAELTAASMGLFGQQAQSVQTKLDAQKQSADGLRQSIVALNDANRAGLGGMIGFEASIDAAAKAARENAGALSMSHGQLNLNSEKARNAASALQDLASKTDEAASSARESGSSWTTVNGIYERGRSQLMASAQAMGLTKKEAGALADQILKIPDKTTLLKGDVQDLAAKIDAGQRKVDALRQKRKTAVGADKADLDKKIAAAQAKLDGLRQKQAVALRAIDKASAIARAIQAAIDKVRSKTVTLTTVRHTINVEATASRNNKNLGGYAGGGTPRKGEVAWVGEHGPELMTFDGTERIFDHNRSMSMIKPSRDAGAFAGAGLASGMAGATSTVGAAARAMAAAVTLGIREELEIASPSKKTKALMADVGKGMILGLTGTQAKIKATAKDLAADIWKAFTGKKDNQLVAMVNRETKKLLDLAKKRDAVAAKIATAKKYASDLTSSAREGAGLSNLGMEPEQVTAGGIKAGLAGKLAQIKQFTKYIDMLAKKGLSKNLLRQILNMGPEAGYAYASALVGADKATFNQINSLQSQLDASTTKLGQVGADSMYDSGKNASKGFLTGLLSQEKEIEAAMLKIAKSMQNALREALGIKSPATKMMPDGENATKGVAVGALKGLPYIDRAMRTVAGRMAGHGAVAPVAGRAAVVAAAGRDTVVHIHVDGAVVDQLGFARAARQALLELKRTNGQAQLGLA